MRTPSRATLIPGALCLFGMTTAAAACSGKDGASEPAPQTSYASGQAGTSSRPSATGDAASVQADSVQADRVQAGSSGTAGNTGSSARATTGSAARPDVGGAAAGGRSGASGSTGTTSADAGHGSSGISGASEDGGTSAMSGGGSSRCDPGTTTTAWATNCSTTRPTCTAGTWTAGGPDPDHGGFALIAQSTHFAIYSDEAISVSTAEGALDVLENTIWTTYFGNPIYFKEPLCDQATKYKASIHVHSDWGLTGGAWSPTRMGMWIGALALKDHWGLGHEFAHAVQSVSGGMRCNGRNTCGWIHESHANFMPHQLAEFRAAEHCSEMLFNAPHLYLGSTRNRYCNWQFMEYLKDKHCYSAVNEIWTGAPIDDPFGAIMRNQGWSVSQLNDFLAEWATHNVTWDYKNPAPTLPGDDTDPGTAFRASYGLLTDTTRPERRLRTARLMPLDESYATNRRFVSPSYWAPQRWGYNVVRLYPEAGSNQVTVTFRGVLQKGADTDFRWALVATNAALTTARYSVMQRGTDGALDFCVTAGESLWLVVMATPSVQQKIEWDQAYASIPRYPYMLALQGAWPEGYRGGAPESCPSGTQRHDNGGGCATPATPATVYVGPNARVLGGTVSGKARIEDFATILEGATVSGGTVGGLSILNRFTVSDSAQVQSTFYPPGFFEANQGLSGTARLLGDVEYRGDRLNKSSGSYSGFVDETSAPQTLDDVTLQGPYVWRP